MHQMLIMDDLFERDTYLVIGREDCSYCTQACDALDLNGLLYWYVDVNENEDVKRCLTENNRTTVPFIIKNGKPIGGYAELLMELDNVK